MDRVLAEHGRVDVCVHSAALIAFGEFLDVPPEVFDHVVTTNVLGTANVARAVLPGMRERDAGVLVVVGSVLGRISVPQLITYCTGKWAVRGLTRMLSQSVRDRRGVRVVGVAPGATNTPVYAQAANVTGRAARPPLPVDPPEKVARAVLRAADGRRRGEASVGLANPVMVLGSRAPAGRVRPAGRPVDGSARAHPRADGAAPGQRARHRSPTARRRTARGPARGCSAWTAGKP